MKDSGLSYSYHPTAPIVTPDFPLFINENGEPEPESQDKQEADHQHDDYLTAEEPTISPPPSTTENNQLKNFAAPGAETTTATNHRHKHSSFYYHKPKKSTTLPTGMESDPLLSSTPNGTTHYSSMFKKISTYGTLGGYALMVVLLQVLLFNVVSRLTVFLELAFLGYPTQCGKLVFQWLLFLA